MLTFLEVGFWGKLGRGVQGICLKSCAKFNRTIGSTDAIRPQPLQILHSREGYIFNSLLCGYQLCKVLWRRKCSCNVLGLRLKLSCWHPTLWVGQVDWGICIWILASGLRCFHLCNCICEEKLLYLFPQLPGFWKRVSNSFFWPNFLPTLSNLQVSLFLKTSLSLQILSQMDDA